MLRPAELSVFFGCQSPDSCQSLAALLARKSGSPVEAGLGLGHVYGAEGFLAVMYEEDAPAVIAVAQQKFTGYRPARVGVVHFHPSCADTEIHGYLFYLAPVQQHLIAGAALAAAEAGCGKG